LAYPVYSSVLFRAQGVTGEHDVFVPAGEVWVVRDLDAYGTVDSLGRIELYLVELPSFATFAWFNWSSGEQNLKQWRGRQVITPQGGAGALRVQNLGGTPVDVSVSGYRFTG